ncbi:hypothetical protein LINPERPRIM_LOCUS40867 [Linum perenne]
MRPWLPIFGSCVLGVGKFPFLTFFVKPIVRRIT